MTTPRPLPNKILVIPEKQSEETTASGIIIADPKHHHVPNKGKVAAIGSYIKLDIKVGDFVHFSEQKPVSFKYNGVGYFVLEADQIKGVYDG